MAFMALPVVTGAPSAANAGMAMNIDKNIEKNGRWLIFILAS